MEMIGCNFLTCHLSHCAVPFDERFEGPYYTHLGAAPDVPGIRHLMEQRSVLFNFLYFSLNVRLCRRCHIVMLIRGKEHCLLFKKWQIVFIEFAKVDLSWS